MTKSTITREQLEEWVAQFDEDGGCDATDRQLEALIRQSLSAMDSEPHTDDELSNLLWYSQEATCHSDPNYYCEFQRLATPGLIAGIILELQERRKAESEPVAEVLSNRPGNDTSTIDRALPFGTQLYRHAQPAPGVPESMPDSVYEILCAACGDKAWAYADLLWSECCKAIESGGKS